MTFCGVDFSIHKEGFRFIAIGAGLSLFFMFFSSNITWICVILTLFCAFFFRNPKRVIPSGDELIVSPADGKVVNISEETPAVELGLGEEQLF